MGSVTPFCFIYLPFLFEYEISGFSFPLIKTNCAAPSFAYIYAGKGVVLENSSVTLPSQPGSKGVTFTIIPHLA